MNRDDFLAGLRAKAEPLHAIEIAGMPTFYVRLETMGDLRASLLRTPTAGGLREAVKADNFAIERSLARTLRDEAGALLFDEADDAQMQQLREVLDGAPLSFDQELRDKVASLYKPNSTEVDASGNSPSASS